MSMFIQFWVYELDKYDLERPISNLFKTCNYFDGLFNRINTLFKV